MRIEIFFRKLTNAIYGLYLGPKKIKIITCLCTLNLTPHHASACLFKKQFSCVVLPARFLHAQMKQQLNAATCNAPAGYLPGREISPSSLLVAAKKLGGPL
jgi:hypothetical protein